MRFSRRAASSASDRGQEPTWVTVKSMRKGKGARSVFEEAEQFARLGEEPEASGAPGLPFLEPLQIHHLAVSRVVVTHSVQHLEPGLLARGGEVLAHGED